MKNRTRTTITTKAQKGSYSIMTVCHLYKDLLQDDRCMAWEMLVLLWDSEELIQCIIRPDSRLETTSRGNVALCDVQRRAESPEAFLLLQCVTICSLIFFMLGFSTNQIKEEAMKLCWKQCWCWHVLQYQSLANEGPTWHLRHQGRRPAATYIHAPIFNI